MTRCYAVLLALALALVAAAAPAPAMAPPPCPGVRFLVDEVVVPGTALPFDAIVVDGGERDHRQRLPGDADAEALQSPHRADDRSCPLGIPCGALPRVRLAAKVDAACSAMTATLTIRTMPRRRFTAPASTCGDGRLDVDAGEQCETSADCPAGDTCTGCRCPSQPPPSTSTTQTTTTTTTTGPPTTTVSGGGLFEAPNPWNTDVSALPKSATSDGIIQALVGAGGWGTGSLRIDFSIEVLEADGTTPFRTFTPTADFYTPDCDHVPFPVPPGGALEGETGYQCTHDGDCHLIVVHRPTKTLYEMWRANITGSTFLGAAPPSGILTRAYPATLRGDQCTSADAGGFPIAAMLFSADEVANGAINHAIRFILPNSRIRSGVYVRPASHAGGPSGGSSLPPYGVRFRLRPDFPMSSLPSEGARVIARALQRYGMILADGGNIALTAQSDRFTAHAWSEVGVDSQALQVIQVTDMEVVGMGTPITLTYDCVRNPEPRSRVLRSIALLKFGKAALLVGVGLGALELVRPEVAARAQMWGSLLASSPGRHVVQRLLAHVSALSPARLEGLGVGAFVYAMLYTVEGVGLWQQKRWAEYLTVIATASFVPFEVYQLVKKVTLPRISALVVNLAIVAYLAHHLRRPR